jgi:BirA family biotin operon repressor/biotin-[acetyl-CoA-carboxylase] ligase
MQGDRARSLAARTRFTEIRWVEETGSTNDDVLAAARSGAAEGLVVVADHQGAGRGRLGRTWQAPPGASLLCTVLLRPSLGPAEAHLAVHALALAAQAACRSVAGVAPALKWPNDLLEPRGTRKVGGILAESVLAGDRLVGVAVGLGLNVCWPTELPDDLAEIAVALNHLGAPDDVSREELLGALLLDLDTRCDQLASEKGRVRLRTAYEKACSTIGAEVRVHLVDGSELEGRAVAVLDDGALLVSDHDGAEHTITSGDVVHLRPS